MWGFRISTWVNIQFSIFSEFFYFAFLYFYLGSKPLHQFSWTTFCCLCGNPNLSRRACCSHFWWEKKGWLLQLWWDRERSERAVKWRCFWAEKKRGDERAAPLNSSPSCRWAPNLICVQGVVNRNLLGIGWVQMLSLGWRLFWWCWWSIDRFLGNFWRICCFFPYCLYLFLFEAFFWRSIVVKICSIFFWFG